MQKYGRKCMVQAKEIAKTKGSKMEKILVCSRDRVGVVSETTERITIDGFGDIQRLHYEGLGGYSTILF